MLYFRKDVTTTYYVDAKDKLKGSSAVSVWKLKITSDIRNTSIEGAIALNTSKSRYDSFLLGNSVISGFSSLDDGSHTYEIKADDIVKAKGKAIIHDGTLTTATKFGDEVTYTEHATTDTNTQYITI